MSERDPHNPYRSQTERQRAKTVRLVILLAALAGVVFGLALAPYLR